MQLEADRLPGVSICMIGLVKDLDIASFIDPKQFIWGSEQLFCDDTNKRIRRYSIQ